MRCANCGAENRESAKFCDDCGAQLQSRCASCGALNRIGAKFCDGCGAALNAQAPSAPAADVSGVPVSTDLTAPDVLDGERKTVTALFADLKGSTELMRDIDPEEARAIVDPVLQLMMAAVHRYDGYVAQSTGDGIFAMFGAPVAHEDHPQRALHAALAIQDELRRYGETRTAGQPALEARIGVNTGEVVLRTVNTGAHTEYSPVGHAANLAARLQTVAPAGGVIVSDDTRKLVEDYFELRHLGAAMLRGIAEPVNVYQVMSAGPLRGHFDVAARRGLTRFVGREHELAQIRRALELAVGGHGQLVAIVAEAGAGKSRLVYEFKAPLPSGCRLLEAYSVSYGRASAWLPVLELLRDYFGIENADDGATRREKVRTALAALDPGLNDTLPYLCGLLGIQETPDPLAQMDPPIRQRRARDAIKRIIVSQSLVRPTVLIFEDLHWIDGETQALLDLVADSIGSARVLLLVNYRPEYRHQWANKSYYSQLRLDALGRESAGQILAALLGESPELDSLKHIIIERTQGNPFFIEEMVQALFDEGALMRNGTVKVMRPLGQLRMPPTVQGILAARIDRLPSAEKDLLQTLAVVGRQAPLAVIMEMVAKPQIERMLGNLQAGEFIYEQAGSSGAVAYEFKHALTQEVAYNSMLIERRKVLHERAGQALEEMFAARLDDYVDELARHYTSSENIPKAVEYLRRSGQQALQRCAPADAANILDAATRLLQKLPVEAERIQLELPLQMTLGYAFILLKGWGGREIEQAFSRALEIGEHLSNPPEIFFALFGLYGNCHVSGDFRSARERAQKLLRLAQTTGDHTHLVLAHYAMGETCLHNGELELAREHQEIVLSLYDEMRDRALAFRLGADVKPGILSYAGGNLWLLGYPDQALATVKKAIAFAQTLSHPNSVAGAVFFLSFVQRLRREARAVKETAERVITFSTEQGFRTWFLFSTHHRGWAIAEQGDYEEGIALMRKALSVAHRAGADIARTDLLCHLAEACMKAGRLDDAFSAVSEALTAVGQQEERYYEAEIHRVKGEVLMRQDGSNVGEPEKCFRHAVEIARAQSGKSLELRATTSLARLLRETDREDEARTMMAEIYGWFTEGFDTADLKEAKGLLDELSA